MFYLRGQRVGRTQEFPSEGMISKLMLRILERQLSKEPVLAGQRELDSRPYSATCGLEQISQSLGLSTSNTGIITVPHMVAVKIKI